MKCYLENPSDEVRSAEIDEPSAAGDSNALLAGHGVVAHCDAHGLLRHLASAERGARGCAV